ncbi:hypothetical protein BS78_02G192000 [Paspalum vaginatum]|nr:hypothetical protein BS78_02G192000 [Paspalum vaginatum]
MKEMIVVFTLMALIASVVSTQTRTCNCVQQQGHEQHHQQQHHQQPQHHQQQQVHHQNQQQQFHEQHQFQGQQQHQQQSQEHMQQNHQQQCQQGMVHEQQHHQPCQGYVQPQHQWQHHEQQQQQQQYQGHVHQQSYYSGNENLYNCHEFIRQQCNPLVMPFLQSRLLKPSTCQVLRQQCCHELRQVEPQYRNQAIYNMVHSIIQLQQQPACGSYGSQKDVQSEVAILTAAQYLPSMCGLYDSYYQSNPCSNNDACGVRN